MASHILRASNDDAEKSTYLDSEGELRTGSPFLCNYGRGDPLLPGAPATADGRASYHRYNSSEKSTARNRARLESLNEKDKAVIGKYQQQNYLPENLEHVFAITSNHPIGS